MRAVMLPLLLAPLALLAAAPAWAGPVVCTTTLEAPPPAADGSLAAPVEVSRCGAVETVPELVNRRYFSYTAPFARGVSLTNQITELFGFAMGGADGTRVMGLGYTDQAIIWDGTAIENTYGYLLDQQSDPMPWRTGDLPNGFSGSLGSASQPSSWQDEPAPADPVRGLW
jgi:hypothetical protein